MSSGLYVKVATNFFSDDRIVECSPLAQLVYLRGLCLVKTIETDGQFTFAQMRRECGDLDGVPDLLAELVKRDLLTEDGQGYTITSWLKHNKSQEYIADYRAKRVEDGKRGGRPKAPVVSENPETEQSERERERERQRQREHPLGNPKGHPKGNPFVPRSDDAQMRRAYLVTGQRKLEADGRDGGDGLAVTIGRDDFGEQLAALHSEHPDWSGDELGQAIDIEPAVLFTAGEMGHHSRSSYEVALQPCEVACIDRCQRGLEDSDHQCPYRLGDCNMTFDEIDIGVAS
jgi:hypothetical protein